MDSEAILSALGSALVEQERRMTAELDLALAAMADDFADTLDRRLAEVPEPRDGAPGVDGLDRVLACPRHIGPAEPFERNEIAWHAGGLWQAVRAGRGDPETDPAAWKCLVPGICAIEAREDLTRRELVFGFRLSDGHLHETRARMLPGLLPPDWRERGLGIIAGDILREGDFERTALVDGADPANVAQWACREIRGRRGRDGKGLPGEPGRPGPALTGLTVVRAPGGRLAIAPTFEAEGVEVKPIPVDLLTEDPPAGRRAIVGFAGRHKDGASYARGDVVAAEGPALWLSLRADNRAPLREGEAWERMV